MPLITLLLETPIGMFQVVHDERHIVRSFFCDVSSRNLGTLAPDLIRGRLNEPASIVSLNVRDPLKNDQDPLSQTITKALSQYFKNPQNPIQLPLSPQGTEYQQRVWDSLLAIPSGQTKTYGTLATHLQSSPRAIGQACKTNPLALFIPCHRVVGRKDIGGYMGSNRALKYKEALLKHELCT